MTKYEQGTRAAITFFSLLVGLALGHFLGNEFPEGDPLETNRWLCFLVGVAIFLRYLVGSANHLWYEYARVGNSGTDAWFMFDLGFLMLFGAVAVCSYFQETLQAVLWWLVGLSGLGIAWGLVGLTRGPKWKFWLAVNAAQLVGLTLVVLLQSTVPILVCGWSLWVFALLMAAIVLFFEDLRRQLAAID